MGMGERDTSRKGDAKRFFQFDIPCIRLYTSMHINAGVKLLRTTLDLPQDLLEEAMYLTDTGTKTAVIVLALEELIRRSKIADLKKYRGKIPLPIDLDTLRSR